METYDLPTHLNNLRMLRDQIKSGYPTFEIFFDALDKGAVPHLSDEFSLKRFKKDFGDNEVNRSFLEEPSEELLQYIKETPALDNVEQYMERIQYEIDQILEFVPANPKNFKLLEIEDIIMNRFPTINGFVKADQDIIYTYTKIMAYQPPNKFFRAIEDFDSQKKENINFFKKNIPNNIENHANWYPNIFSSPQAFTFFQILIETRAKEKQLAEISFYYRRFKYHQFINTEINEINFIRWLSETYQIELSKIKTLQNCYTEKREKYFNLLKGKYMN